MRLILIKCKLIVTFQSSDQKFRNDSVKWIPAGRLFYMVRAAGLKTCQTMSIELGD